MLQCGGLWLFSATLSCLLHLTSSVREFPTLEHLRASASPEDQAQAVTDLIRRKIGDRESEFKVTVDPAFGTLNRDTFMLHETSVIAITGSSGVAAAWGFYYYLSQYCGCHISWAGDQLNLPAVLPSLPPGGVTITSLDRFRYYQNVCTVSYSFAWWDWTRWETEIDWMAMNGINLPLAFTAQEAIWQRVLLNMTFTNPEIDDHFGGAAFLAWSRMGNMHGWGGPLPQSWHTQQVALQHQILDRMRAFGMIPVLPAFSGYVPDAITRVFPSANVSDMGYWSDFHRPLLLDVEDPLFITFGHAFLHEYIAEFGTDHIYNADTFNENTPSSSDPEYLKRAGRAVFDAMVVEDPDAIWLMQGWLFYSDEEFWQPAQAEALLTSVPQGKMIVLDLTSESYPQYVRLNSYYGQPFVWCMLQNYGATLGMFGTIETIYQGPSAGRTSVNSTMIGIGLTMEGIDQNNIVYEFMLENSWREDLRNVTQWMIDFNRRRYGISSPEADTALLIFTTGVYNCTTGYRYHGREIITQRPQYVEPLAPPVWYSVEEFYVGWDYMILASDALSTSLLFRYDLVDVTRQALQIISIFYYNEVLNYYSTKDYTQFKFYSTELLDLFLDVDRLLATDEHFLLGNWLERAKSWSTNEQEKQLYEYNARNQITLWGPDGNILDYASKQWAGLVAVYYYPRWQMFLEELDQQWNTTFDEAAYQMKVFDTIEEPFTFDRTVFPTVTTGDQITVAKEIHSRYRPVTRPHAAFFNNLREASEDTFTDVKSHPILSHRNWVMHNQRTR